MTASALPWPALDLPVVFMFPGQGCQYFHMGRELYREDARFRRWMTELDDRIAPWLGGSVLGHIYDERKTPSDPFVALEATHQAIFMIEYALAQVLRERGFEPAIVLGASLGEITAAAVSGALPVEDCIRVLAANARIVSAVSDRGGMIAILHAPALYDEVPDLHRHCEIAGVNFDDHFVVAGRDRGLERVIAYLRRAGIPHQRLIVDCAFHSSLLDPLRGELEASVAGLDYRRPAIPLVSCATGGVVDAIDGAHYWRVFRGATVFDRALRALEATGPHAYLDIGPTGTLSTFTRQLLPAGSRSITCPTLTQFGQDQKTMARAMATLGWSRTT